MQIKTKFLLGAYIGLTSNLGFKRGVDSYLYELERDNKRYKIDNQKKNFFYSQSVLNGALGIFLYVIPPVNLIMLQKEIYRLEVNLRDLESEKNSDYYNLL
jgi:hypothetical protein